MKVMRTVLGVSLGFFVSMFCTGLFILLVTPRGSFNLPPGASTLGFLVVVGIIGVAAFVGGLVGRNLGVGFLSGLAAGMFGAPVAAAYVHASLGSLSSPWEVYWANLEGYFLLGLLGGTVGVFGSWIQTRTHSPGNP